MRTASFSFNPHRLVALLLTPRAFFADPNTTSDRRGIMIAAALAGIANAIDRIDQGLLKSDMRSEDVSQLTGFYGDVVNSWFSYWTLVLIGGMVSSVVSWYLRGWWYRKRLEWSGAEDVPPDDARSVATLQNLVLALPLVALPVIQTFSYANYAEAWNANSAANMLLIVFVLWSCWTSYCAATTVFTLRKGSARFWFLILPLVFYVLALGVIGVIYSLIH
ncbi:hypothetical protein GJ699_06665 [Duganella sp. FT80W]|uniref:Yip1 domain-containing protein n=1 Tax=Duganella guangzhouensis TaxID=2666084 RepID=A0A6I2KVY7_9BURK|nr:hypothetical protein [Duganella guangzhouensis]MRW89660.1 hypothetical protein [Duganella guangzhouensis]